MNADEQKHLEELIALYQLESDVRDIYVEGARDKHLLKWFLGRHDRSDITVYTVDEVHVPEEVLRRHRLPGRSNRSKVIALSCELDNAPSVRGKVLCVADRDYEDFIPCPKRNQYLAFTDFTSFELYVFDPCCVGKFTSVVLGDLPIEGGLLLSQARAVLQSLFFVRLTNEVLGWSMTWVRPRKYIRVSRDSIAFDEDGFINAYLQTNGRGGNRDEFLTRRDTLREHAPDEDRRIIRGHDLVDTLHYVAKRLKSRRRLGDSDFFGGAFLGCLEAHDLTEYPLFQRLLSM